MSETSEELVCIGRVARVRGVTGELEVEPLGETASCLVSGSTVFLEETEGATPRPFCVADLRQLGRRLGLTLEGVETPEAAKPLVGNSVFVDAESLPKLAKGLYYHYQIVGLTVVDVEGRELGEIEEILETGGNDVYVVRKGENEILIPATDEVVVEIDLDAGRMKVDVLPGLIE